MPGRIGHLSLSALRLAASRSWAEADDVAQWLYRFGTLPRGPTIDLDFGPDDDPMAVLGLTVGGRARRYLEAAYDATSDPGWYSFTRADTPVHITSVCKLYVSPRPEALAGAFPRIAKAFGECGVRSFKVGRGVEGLLRSDKIIAYFDDWAHLDDTVAVLGRSLRDCPPQGVPFTSEAGGNGLLSSGVDPPAGNRPTSWRAWVTQRLAASLTTPRHGPRADPVAAALADMRREGVDPDRWLPSGDASRDEMPQ